MTDRSNKQKWRLDLPSHDALEGLSEKQRLEIIDRLNVHVKRNPAIRTLTIVAIILSMAAGIFLNDPFAVWFQSLGMRFIVAKMIGAGLASLITIVVVLVIGYWILWSIVTRALRTTLREIGKDVCLECGYWLRGLGDEVTQCPECGAGREASGRSG